jgi:hypothetical protein
MFCYLTLLFLRPYGMPHKTNYQADCLLLSLSPLLQTDHVGVGTVSLNVYSGIWTNNNSESVNHVIKQYAQWKPQQLPDLIDKLHQLIVAQYEEANLTLIGRKDLQPQHAKC